MENRITYESNIDDNKKSNVINNVCGHNPAFTNKTMSIYQDVIDKECDTITLLHKDENI